MWETKDSLGFNGYRYEKGKHFAMPIYADGGPSQIIVGENLYHDFLTMRTFPGCEKIFTGKKIDFTSGGTHEVIAGDTLTGATSGATLYVESIVLVSGSWAAGTAAGYFYITDIVGTFQDENLNEGANPNVCTIQGTTVPPYDIRLGSAGKYTCVGAFPYIASNGDVYIVLCYPDKIYAWQPGDDCPREIQGAVSLTGSNENYFSATYFADTTLDYDPWMILTNGVDTPIKWVDAAGSCSTLGGTPPIGEHISNFGGHIFISNITSGGVNYGQRDRRSNVDAAETWSGALSGSNDLRQSPGDIQGDLTFGDLRFIFKEYNISVVRATGYDPPFTYDEDELPIGCIAPNTICKALKYDYGFFMGHDQNLYLLRKDGGYIAIGESIKDRIVDWANDDRLKYSFALYHPGLDQIVLAVPTSNNANYCQAIFMFDIGHYIRTGGEQIIWSTPIYLPFSVTSGCPAKMREPYSIGELGSVSTDGTIGGLAGSIGNLFMEASFSEILMADNQGYVYRFDENLLTWDGTDITWNATLKDLHLASTMTDKFRLMEYELFFRNAVTEQADCTISVSVDGGANFDSSQTVELYSSTGASDEELSMSAYFDTVSKKHRIRLVGSFPAQILGQRWHGTTEGRQ